jgi:DNA-binding NtrC family response regulator
MKRSFLFIGYEPSLYVEIMDFMHEHHGEALFSNSTEQSISTLNEFPVEAVVLTLHKLNDAAILKYINQYYPGVKVLIAASKEYDDLIDVFNKGHYSMLKQPLKLEELNLFF